MQAFSTGYQPMLSSIAARKSATVPGPQFGRPAICAVPSTCSANTIRRRALRVAQRQRAAQHPFVAFTFRASSRSPTESFKRPAILPVQKLGCCVELLLA